MPDAINGGNVIGITISDALNPAFYSIESGSGGNGTTLGGSGGDVKTIAVNAPNSRLAMQAENGGNAATGGAGGKISGLTGNFAILNFIAGNGGTGTTGAGGNGGSVDSFNVTISRYTDLFNAGSGGNSTSAAGGLGGSVSGIKVIGDIGRFEGAQSFGTGTNSMTGLYVGQGGVGVGAVRANNGSVLNVTAKRIAAILAGDIDSLPSDLGVENAVFAIAGVVASKIGTDLDLDGIFDFTDTGAPGFLLTGTDIVIDGIVIVRAAGFTATSLSVAPLKLETV